MMTLCSCLASGLFFGIRNLETRITNFGMLVFEDRALCAAAQSGKNAVEREEKLYARRLLACNYAGYITAVAELRRSRDLSGNAVHAVNQPRCLGSQSLPALFCVTLHGFFQVNIC